MSALFTIGHSNQSIESFVDLLRLHGVESVYDVRSKPYSRFLPQFRRENLEKELAGEKIGYVFMGDKLGGKPKPAPEQFELGLSQLRADAPRMKIAVMCAEKHPMNCHRCWSIAENLPDLQVMHIHGDGHLQSHVDLMREQPPKQASLF